MRIVISSLLMLTLACDGQVNVKPPVNGGPVGPPAGQRAVYCYSNPAVDDSPVIRSALKSGTITMLPAGQSCHVNLANENSIPSGSKLMGIPGQTVLEPFKKGQPVVDSSGQDVTAPIHDITIEGITFDADGVGLQNGRAGIVTLRYVTNLRFVNNIIRSSNGAIHPGEALKVINSDGLIEGNDISGGGLLVDIVQEDPGHLPNGVGPTIANNRIHDNSSGPNGGGNGIFIHGNDNFSSQRITDLSYIVQPTDKSYLTTFSNRAGTSVTLPKAGATTRFPDGWGARFLNTSESGKVVFKSPGSTINGSSAYTLIPGLGAEIYSTDGVNYLATTVNAQTASSYEVRAEDCENIVAFSGSRDATVTLPKPIAGASACGFGFGFKTRIVNLGSGKVTIAAPPHSDIDGKPTLVLISGQPAEIVGDGATYTASPAIFPFPYQLGLDFPVAVTGNIISGIHNRPGDTGATGNGIHAYHVAGVRIENNTISGTSYSCIRSSNSDDVIAIGNYCSNSGETALYSEYSSQGTIWQGNIVNGAGNCLLSPANFNPALSDTHHVPPGKLSIIQGNRLKNCGSWGIQAESYAEISDNIIEHTAGPAIQIGYGSFEQNVHVHHNLIVDGRAGAPGATTVGICIEHGSGSLNHIVESNMFDLPAGVPHIAACDHGKIFRTGALQPGVTVRSETVPRALIGTPDNGSFIYIPDAAASGNCSQTGSGAFGKRLGGAWNCS